MVSETGKGGFPRVFRQEAMLLEFGGFEQSRLVSSFGLHQVLVNKLLRFGFKCVRCRENGISS